MAANIKLCMFDFDNTLVDTSIPELDRIRPSLANRSDTAALENFVLRHKSFFQVDIHFLQNLRVNFPELKLGVFTKSPTAYVLFMLKYCFPDFAWDAVIAYEHVSGRYKPNPYGLKLAMNNFGISNPEDVIYVGDDDRDQLTAQNCGCVFVHFNLSMMESSCKSLFSSLLNRN